MAMKIVNGSNDVSTAVVNANASDTNEMNTRMMTAKMNTLPENPECSKLLSMGRNLWQILCATVKDAESVSRNLLMLLVRLRYPLDDLLMQQNLRFLKSKFLFCGGNDRKCTFGEHSVLHTSGLRAILLPRQKTTTTSGFERRKKINFASSFYLCSFRGKLFAKRRTWIPYLFVLHLGAIDHKMPKHERTLLRALRPAVPSTAY